MSLSIDKIQITESVAFMSRCKYVTSIDKIQNIESVAFMSRCKYVTSRCNYITLLKCHTHPSEEIMHPSSEIMVAPSSEIIDPSEKIMSLTSPVESVKVIRIDPYSGNKE